MGALDAEDVTGSTFESVARTIGNFTGSDSQFRSWVFTIAHGRMVDDHRRRSRRPEVKLGNEVERIVDDRLDTIFGGDERIEHALAQLNSDQRNLLHLRYVMGFSIREVATHTDRTEEATRAAIHRCTKRLRELVSLEAVAAT
jgi:RNA polymerase sigma-70 factor (ECF subfamily)